LKEEFDGHSNCFIESGNGKALLIDFNYEHEPHEGNFPFAFGPMKLLEESRLQPPREAGLPARVLECAAQGPAAAGYQPAEKGPARSREITHHPKSYHDQRTSLEPRST
jgi:hypothetical protein